jgi:hypothetical protein
MGLAMRNCDRLYSVAFNPAPAHFKGFSLVYAHCYLSRGEILAFHGTRGAVSERDRSDSQMFVECEPAGWFTQCKVDQVMPQMLAPDRSHRGLHTDGRGTPILSPLLGIRKG